MIVLFTANKTGGIVQLTQTVAKTLRALGREIVVFCNSEAGIDGDFKVERFDYVRTLLRNSKPIKRIAERIKGYEPEAVVFLDDALLSAFVLLQLNRNTKCIQSVHDVVFHSGVNTTLKYRIINSVKMVSIKTAYRKADKILLYSHTSEKLFKQLYPALANKTTVIRLGAHLTTTAMRRPPEMSIENEDFALFFGNIDGYKGVDFLLRQFHEEPALYEMKLVIAGRASANYEWLENRGRENIKIIQRYIENEEMNWLFSHCRCVVLPYRDASQSGVIPIAYHFGKPVLISNLPGLSEYVIDGVTGRIYKSEDSFSALLVSLYNNATHMESSVLEYTQNELNWEKNISDLLPEIEEE